MTTERILHFIDLRDQANTKWNARRTPWTRQAETVDLELPIEEGVERVLVASPDVDGGRTRNVPFRVADGSLRVEVPIAGPWTTVVVK